MSSKKTTPTPPQPSMITLADITESPVDWLWWPYLAKETIAMLDGDPGLGKSWLTLQIAACLSRGWPLPDQQGHLTLKTGSPQQVILITSEDSPEHTIRPRFMRAGGDPLNAHILNGWIDPEKPTELQAFTLQHIHILEDALQRYHPAMVVIDPLQAYLGKIDMHRSNETRPLMARLAALASEYKTAMVCIRHPSKPGQNGGRAIHRGLGSIDFIGIARTGLNLLPHPLDTDKGLLAQGKNNLGPLGRTLIFSKAEGQFQWAGVTRLGADLLTSTGYGPEAYKLIEACLWLEDALGGGLPQPAKDLEERMAEEGLKRETIKKAKKALGIKSIRHGGVKDGAWDWNLPALSLLLPQPQQPQQPLQSLQPLQPLRENQRLTATTSEEVVEAEEAEEAEEAVVAGVIVGDTPRLPPHPTEDSSSVPQEFDEGVI